MRSHQLESGLQVVVEAGDPDEASDMALCEHTIGPALQRHYPDHPWLLDVQGRAIILRHRVITRVADEFLNRSGFGYLMPPHRKSTPKAMTESAIQAGGQMLEYFGLKRGRCEYPDEEEFYRSGLVKIPSDWVKGKTRTFK